MHIFRIDGRVYFSDTDATGRASWKSIFDWAEHGRTEMLREANPQRSQSDLAAEDGIITVIKSIDCRKLSDAYLDDSILVETWMEKVQRFSCMIGQRISSSDSVVAEFSVKAAFIDSSTKHPVLIPDDFRKALEGEDL